MHVKFQQQFGDQPKDKEITVEFRSQLKDLSQTAVCEFPNTVNVKGKSFSIGLRKPIVLRIPLTVFDFVLKVTFPKSSPVEVSATVNGSKVSGLTIDQQKIDFVEANLKHASGAAEPCTVMCANGESRTGIGACISCPGPRGTVKLCC